ncbi:MAG: hypothetical protein ACI3ZQ_09590 [Candidatus Cryptobacteroides sp.]
MRKSGESPSEAADLRQTSTTSYLLDVTTVRNQIGQCPFDCRKADIVFFCIKHKKTM